MTPGPAPPRNPGEGLRHAGVIAWSVLGILALAAVGSVLLYQIREIFPPLVLALALIFLLNPLVTRLERRGIPRGAGTAAIYLLFILVLVLMGLLVIPPVASQVSDLVMNFRLPNVDSVIEWLEGTARRFGMGLTLDPGSVNQLVERLQGEIFQGLGQITRITLGALHIVLVFVLAPIFALYLLIDLPRLQAAFKEHLPPARREEWLMLLERCGQAVGGFFRGQLLVAVIVGTLSSVGLLAVRLPYWLAIGLVAGFFNIIPLIGPWVGGAIAVVVGAVTGGPTKALFAALAMLAVQQIDNHFISPNVMGRAVRLHPVTIMVALLAGGTLAGLWGMLLAVPATAVAKILLMHYYSTNILGRQSPYLEPPEPPPPAGEEPADREPAAVAAAGETGGGAHV